MFFIKYSFNLQMNKIRTLLPLIGLAAITILSMNLDSLTSLVKKSTNNGKGEQSFVSTSPDIKQQVLEAYGNVPLSFELNQGQTSEEVKFLSRGNGYNLFLTGNEAVIALNGTSKMNDEDEKKQTVLRMKLHQANSAPRVVGEEPIPSKSNYFSGKDQSNWRTNIPQFAKIKYEDVYPGVDMVYYGNQRELEYDFIVSPNSDANRILMDISGANDLSLDERGNLNLATGGESLTLKAPVIYQEINDSKQYVAGNYVIKGENRIGFEIGDYDKSMPLVIDPVLSYSTYLGGSGFNLAYDVAVDSAGNAYVTGFTGETNFPTTSGSFDPSNELGGRVAFVSKLNPEGTGLVYSTFLGRSSVDGFSIAVDSTGSAYVTGYTGTHDFPITSNAFQPAFQGNRDAFATKLSPDGSSLLYSTFIGGNFDDEGTGIAVDSQGNAIITGTTDCYSTDCTFPIVNAFQPTRGGGAKDAFVTKLNVDGSALVYSTYLGGGQAHINLVNDYGEDVAVDSAGNAYAVGSTYSPDFPTTEGAFDRSIGASEAYVAKFSPTGALIYSTFIGGGDTEECKAIAVDSTGNAYITGFTFSYDFPTTSGAYKTNLVTPFDAFVTKLNPQGSGLVYSTYLGSDDGSERAWGIAVDSSGNAYITGDTNSSNFPVLNAVQPNYREGLRDAFVTKLNATGSALIYSTYLGGSLFDYGFSIAVDSNANAYVVGQTSSYDFPTTSGTLQPANGGGIEHHDDAFITKISDTGLPPATSPAVPANLNATATSSTQINLTWADNSDNETGFKIERCSGTGCVNFVQIAQVISGVQNYTDSGLPASTAYRYRVRAFNNNGNSSYSNIAEARTLAPPSPADSVAVQKAQYTISKKSLQVEATSSSASAVMKVYVTSTGAYIGTLGNSGKGRYRGTFAWSVNPQNITIKSSLGGSAAKAVTAK